MKIFHIKKLTVLLLGLILISFTPWQKKKIRVYLIGDSTMCLYPASRAPLTGWGMPFAGFFDSTVQIENRAKGGRSTKTFINEKWWQPIADSLQEGDYVMIQFGHNDEAKQPQYAERYTPVPDYKINLIKFITEARAKKAFPILLTPVTRRTFKEGKITETHVEYTAAVYEVARELEVPMIDLDKRSRELLQQFGPEYSRYLFMDLQPGENPNYPNGQKDNTHFNEFGARLIAQLVLADIRALKLELADRIIKRDIK